MPSEWVLEYWRNKKKIQEAPTQVQRQIPANVKVGVARFSNSKDLVLRIGQVGNLSTYVGIPAGTAQDRTEAMAVKIRFEKILNKIRRMISLRKDRYQEKIRVSRIAARTNMSNAYLLYIFSHGSILRNQPARPVLQAAVMAPWNRKQLATILAEAIKLDTAGKHSEAKRKMKSLGATAAKMCRDWFFDPRNGWPPNALSTEYKKGFNQPGKDTGVMIASITHIEKEG